MMKICWQTLEDPGEQSNPSNQPQQSHHSSNVQLPFCYTSRFVLTSLSAWILLALPPALNSKGLQGYIGVILAARVMQQTHLLHFSHTNHANPSGTAWRPPRCLFFVARKNFKINNQNPSIGDASGEMQNSWKLRLAPTGVLVSDEGTEPIIPMGLLTRNLKCSIRWTEGGIEIIHPVRGHLQVQMAGRRMR